jgi:hypothetical protein
VLHDVCFGLGSSAACIMPPGFPIMSHSVPLHIKCCHTSTVAAHLHGVAKELGAGPLLADRQVVKALAMKWVLEP